MSTTLQGHRDIAARLEADASSSLAMNRKLDDPRNPSYINGVAEAQVLATLALSHRLAVLDPDAS